MKKIYFLFLLPILLLTSCTKPLVETGSVSGIVKDATTGEPIANADVFLLQNEIGDGDIWGGGGPSEQIDYTTSDANGNFSFLFDYDKNYSYLCGAEATLYFDLDQEFSVDDEVKEGNNVEVLLNPVAFLSIHYENVVPNSLTDNFAINGYITDGFDGAEIDTTIIYSVQGNVNNILHWGLYGDIVQTDSIYCPSFDTTYFEILY